MEGLDRTIIEGGDGFGGASMLAEWYNANVYTSPITDARVSKLRALCNLAEDKQTILQNAQDKDISLSLIGRGAKDNGNNRTGTATRPNAKSN